MIRCGFQQLFDGLDLLEQELLQIFVAGDDFAVPDVAGGAGEVGDEAAGFLDHQGAGGDVPGGKTGLPGGVEAAGGEPGQIDRDRAGAADAGDGGIDVGDLTDAEGV